MNHTYKPAREQRRAHHDFPYGDGEPGAGGRRHGGRSQGGRAQGARRRRDFGAPPGFGPPSGFGPGPKRGRRGGRERGDVRTAVLVLLAEQPRHGYDLMRAIEERTDGAWSPSPGSIYPTLQALEDEGLITFETIDGRKTATLTDDGSAWVGEHAKQAEAVFARGGDRPAEILAMREEVHGLHDAIMAVGRTRDAAVATQATAILAAARRDIYRLLADR